MGKLILGIVCAPVLIFAGLCAAVCLCAMRKRRADAADCLLVLGAKVHPDGSLSNTLRKRCDAAFRAWERKLAPYIVLCGGRGAGTPFSQAAAMRNYLLQKQIPQNRLILEEDSSNTTQNLCNAEKIMRTQGWKSAVIVTSDYHMQRALWIARDRNIPAGAVVCPSPDHASHWIKSRIQESVSWILYAVRKINRTA